MRYSDYPPSESRPQWKMSTDGGSRVDQYFVKSYTEVRIIPRYRSNLNRSAGVRAPHALYARYAAATYNKNLYKLKECFVCYCDSFGWAPMKGSLSIFIFPTCPSRHARRLYASRSTTVSRTNTTARKVM